MDADSIKKEQTLLKIRDEAHRWLDKDRLPDQLTDFNDHWMKLKSAEILGDKFVNDHNGYLVALGEYKAHKRVVDAMQTASDRAARATKELEQLKQAQEV